MTYKISDNKIRIYGKKSEFYRSFEYDATYEVGQEIKFEGSLWTIDKITQKSVILSSKFPCNRRMLKIETFERKMAPKSRYNVQSESIRDRMVNKVDILAKENQVDVEPEDFHYSLYTKDDSYIYISAKYGNCRTITYRSLASEVSTTYVVTKEASIEIYKMLQDSGLEFDVYKFVKK